MNKKIFLLVLVFLFSFTVHSFSQENTQTVRRFGLFVGSNYGGRDRSTLLYASTDANRLAEVMHEMGGLEREDSIVLYDPDPSSLRYSFNQMANKIESALPGSRRVEFIFYYSGHSDEQGLLLGNNTILYGDLREKINTIGADVNIAILDSCFSGSFTRLKGGVRQPPFLLDQSVDTRGHAFLTSSSADEAAQESDALGASFFTHYFISGLRGAADANQDGKITLHEAHAYASAETLARTTHTQAGPQHPSYEINLSGSGDLVLTDLRITTAQIILGQDIEGKLFIRDRYKSLVAELRKSKGVPVYVALPPGKYTLTLDSGRNLYETNITLGNGGRVNVSSRDFSSTFREIARLRGDDPVWEEKQFLHLDSLISPISHIPDSASTVIVHNLALGLITNVYRIQGFSVGLLNFITEDLRGVQIAPVLNTVGRDVKGAQLAGVFNISSGSVYGAQVSGIFNIASGEVQGGQVSGVFNIAEDVNFAQASGVFNIADGNFNGFQGAGVFNTCEGSFDGFQGAGVFNICGGYFDGFQGAGVFNIISEGKGFQGAGVFNMTDGFFDGFQGAGVFNAAGNYKGFQLSTVNVAKDIEGVQLGVVNIGKDVKGTQIGIVNINRDIEGFPIGIINISSEGLHNLSAYSDEKGFTYIGFQFGTKSFYTFLFGGFNSNNNEEIASGLGLGVHFTAGPLYLDVDFSAKQMVMGKAWEERALNFFNFGTQTFPSLRVSLGLPLAKRLALFGGIMVDGLIEGITEPTTFHAGSPAFTLPFGNSGPDIHGYYRWFLGIRI